MAKTRYIKVEYMQVTLHFWSSECKHVRWGCVRSHRHELLPRIWEASLCAHQSFVPTCCWIGFRGILSPPTGDNLSMQLFRTLESSGRVLHTLVLSHSRCLSLSPSFSIPPTTPGNTFSFQSDVDSTL